jgi:hypothetical protein
LEGWLSVPMMAFVISTLAPAHAYASWPVQAVPSQRSHDVRAVALQLGLSEGDNEAPVEQKILGLVTFAPSITDEHLATDRFARTVAVRSSRQSYSWHRNFVRERWNDFQLATDASSKSLADLSAALAYAITTAYRAYNGDRLQNEADSRIFRAVVMTQIATAQWAHPWSAARKADAYVTWGLQGALMNWFYQDARRRGDRVAEASVRKQAKWLLSTELGKDPSSIKLDRYPCAIFSWTDCVALIRDLHVAVVSPAAP